MTEDDLLIFNDEQLDAVAEAPAPWNILVVDDEEDIHQVTRLVLSRFHIEGRPLNILSARTIPEAHKILLEEPDIAVAILDVVMEEEDSGLQLARYIREEKGNHFTRIVLRTGQPGQAPEAEVVERYDINDYKEKTELTTQKLRTMCISLIRSYRDLCQIDEHRRGLQRLISTTSEIFEATQLTKFACIILEQVMVLLRLNKDAIFCQLIQRAAPEGSNDAGDPQNSAPEFHVLAASGEHQHLVDQQLSGVLRPDILQAIQYALAAKQTVFTEHSVTGYYRSISGNENILYVTTGRTLSTLDKELLDLYSRHVALAYEHLAKNES